MKNARGYTLLEILFTVAIFSVVILGVYGVLLTGDIVFNKDMTLLEMESQSRNAIDRIVREVRQASSQVITANYNGTTNDKILFTTPSYAGVQYYLSGTALVREYPAGTVVKLASNINLLKFTLVGSLLTIQTQASQTLYNSAVTFPLIEKVRLRNE
ncbi:MAG: prepilin-type N-terminal cleavage/methylation domain-containing protein [Candidatus Omnitrophota bacterium]